MKSNISNKKMSNSQKNQLEKLYNQLAQRKSNLQASQKQLIDREKQVNQILGDAIIIQEFEILKIKFQAELRQRQLQIEIQKTKIQNLDLKITLQKNLQYNKKYDFRKEQSEYKDMLSFQEGQIQKLLLYIQQKKQEINELKYQIKKLRQKNQTTIKVDSQKKMRNQKKQSQKRIQYGIQYDILKKDHYIGRLQDQVKIQNKQIKRLQVENKKLKQEYEEGYDQQIQTHIRAIKKLESRKNRNKRD